MPDDPDEDYVIHTLGPTAPFPGLRRGIGDDAASFDDGLCISTDTMVEGVHWDSRLDPADVGYKLVAVNVSDLAAAGAEPRWATLNLSVPRPLDRAWILGFSQGLKEALIEYGLSLIGGDTTRSPVRTLSLTVGGYAPTPADRGGGQPGDRLYITGELGRSAEALLSSQPRATSLNWLRRPRPRLQFALAIAPQVHAMMDLSDGLSLDLHRLCRRSACSATIIAANIPGDRPLNWKISFGEDYELLFAVPPIRADVVESAAAMTDTPLSFVGHLTPGTAPPVLLGAPGWPPALFSHFGAA